MTELVEKLAIAGQEHKNTLFGGLLQWALLHIQSQDEAMAEMREELEFEQNERIRLENALHTASQATTTVLDCLKAAQPVNIKLSRDYAPHINVMAHYGVAPYAKRKGKK